MHCFFGIGCQITLYKVQMKKLLICLILIALSTGCASRAFLQKDNILQPAFNLYNRNFVVAAPTFIGNLICGTPFFFIAGGIDALIAGEKSETYTQTINGIWLTPASICGFVAGLAFVPVSFACKEEPWNFDFHSVHNRSWSCH